MIVTDKGKEIERKNYFRVYISRNHFNEMVKGAVFQGKIENRKILMTVITRYQLTDVKSLIRDIDPSAFVNITEKQQK